MAKTYIIGHQKPDTDSVVAAMALEYLYSQAECFGYENPQAVLINEPNPETTFLLNKFGVEAPPVITADQITAEDKIVLVDHNEESQRLPGINPDQIVEIIDHHKANLNLNKPIFMTFKAWGCSATIVYYMMKRYAETPVTPDKKLASLMLAAVLSDTVGFKSATTTDKDLQLGKELAKLAEIDDIDAFAFEIFKAKSDVSQLSDMELVKNDYKKYEFAESVLIGQLETVEQEAVLTQRKDGILQAMKEVQAAEGVDHIFIAVTDVLKVNTKLLVVTPESQAVAEKAFAVEAQNGVLDIGPKMSRKKEIAPAIEAALAE